MRIILLILILILCLSVNFAYAEPKIISYAPNGEVFMTTFNVKKGYGPKDAEQIVNNSPILKGLPYEIIDSSELPLNPDGTKIDRDCWVKNPNGKGIIIDQAKKAQKEQKELEEKNKKKALENKLKTQGFTNEEIEILTK